MTNQKEKSPPPPLVEEPVIPVPDGEKETDASVSRWLALGDRALGQKRPDRKTE